MNSTPRSFRLSKQAQETLKNLAEDFNLSENKVVEILLTFSQIGSGPNHSAWDLVNRYFMSKIDPHYFDTLNREAEQTPAIGPAAIVIP